MTMKTTHRSSTHTLSVLKAALVAAACLLAATTAQAQGAQGPGPAVRHEGGVSYVTGGIGEAGEQRARDLGRDMNLQLVFANAPGGSYVADADVTIANAQGQEVLHVNSANPLLFARLEPGRYEVSATSKGRTIKRVVQVPPSGQHAEYFHWQSADSPPSNQ